MDQLRKQLTPPHVNPRILTRVVACYSLNNRANQIFNRFGGNSLDGRHDLGQLSRAETINTKNPFADELANLKDSRSKLAQKDAPQLPKDLLQSREAQPPKDAKLSTDAKLPKDAQQSQLAKRTPDESVAANAATTNNDRWKKSCVEFNGRCIDNKDSFEDFRRIDGMLKDSNIYLYGQRAASVLTGLRTVQTLGQDLAAATATFDANIRNLNPQQRWTIPALEAGLREPQQLARQALPVIAAGIATNYLIDRFMFPDAKGSLLSTATSWLSPIAATYSIPWIAKIGVISGAHVAARLVEKFW